MEIAVRLDLTYSLGTDFHVCHTKYCCDQKHRDRNTQDSNAVLFLVNLSVLPDQIQIAFHSARTPRSVNIPSETCKTRSAAEAMFIL